jgi:hypothetical protein
MEGGVGTIVATLIPIVAFLFVAWETRSAPPLHSARVAFGALAILGAMGLFQFLRILREDTSAMVMASRFVLPGALSIAGWLTVMRDRPGRNGLLFATAAALIIAALPILGLIGSALLVSMLAESGRRADASVAPFVLVAIVTTLANAGLGVMAFRAVRRLSEEKNT